MTLVQLFPSKNENKGGQKCLLGLITAARDTCTFAFPLYELVVQTHATLQKLTQPLAFDRLLSLGNRMKKMTVLLFILTVAKLALFETKHLRITCSRFIVLAYVALTSL